MTTPPLNALLSSFQQVQPKTRREVIAENLRLMKENNEPPEVVQAFLRSVQVTPEEEMAIMPRTMLENVRGAAQSLTQGATLNFGDEIVGTIRGMTDDAMTIPEAIADERASLGEFREANPKTALGLELAGGIATGVGTTRALPAAGRLAVAANPLKTAAAVGAAAGAGAGESPLTRGGLGIVGGIAGPAVTKGFQSLATSRIGDAMIRGWDNINRSGQPVMMAPRAVPTTAPAAPVAATTPGTAMVRYNPDNALPAPTVGTTLARTGSNVPARTGGVPARMGASTAEPIPMTAAGTGPAEEIAGSIPRIRMTPGRRIAARALLDKQGRPDAALRELGNWADLGMADDVTLINAGGARAANTARAMGNAPMSEAADVLDAALARQGSRLGAKVGQDIEQVTGLGSVPGPVRLKSMQAELERRTSDAFEAFRQRGDVLPTPRGMAFPQMDDRTKLAVFLGDEATADVFLPYVDAVRKLSPTLRGRASTDADVLLTAFQDVQANLRKAGRGTDNAGPTRMLTDLRNRVLDALEQVDPEVARVTRQYALDEDVGKVVQRAAERGGQLTKAPVGTFSAETLGEPKSVADAMRVGMATQLRAEARDMAANVDLGRLAKFRDVAGRMAGNQGFADRFREVFGEKPYQALMERLSPKIRAAALNAVVRGNSTTARQILAAMAEGDQAVVDVMQATATGGMMSGATAAAGKYLFNPARAALTGAMGDAATEAAQLLGTRGSKRGEKVLRALAQLEKQDAKRRAAVAPVAGVAVRAGVNR